MNLKQNIHPCISTEAKIKLQLVRKALTDFKSLIDYELPINHPKVVNDLHDEKEATTKVIATNDNMDFEGKFDVDTVKNEIPNNDIKEEMFDGDINLKVIGSYYRQRSADWILK